MKIKDKNVYLIPFFLTILLLSSCGGGGGGGGGGGEPPPSEGSRISGVLSIEASVVADTDLNDPFADYVDNSSLSNAQRISNLVTVQGFLTDNPTGNTNDTFEFLADVDDYFQVSLQAGQQVQMQVVDYSGFSQNSERYSGDLDLALFDSEFALLSVSESETEFEVITIPEDGLYYVNPYAFSGASKYVLRFVSATNSLSSNEKSVDFIPGEAIMKMAENNNVSAKFISDMGLSKLSHDQVALRSVLVNLESGDIQGRLSSNLNPAAVKSYRKLETLKKIKRLSQRANIEYAIPNYILQPMRVPQDEFYGFQWHYPAMNLPQAWDITTGTAEGREVIVAVVDTGVVPHPDLQAQLIAGYDFISDPARALDGDGIDSNADDPGDKNTLGESSWHGTHVAGTVAAQSDNADGVAGVSWGAKIMPVRVLGLGGGTAYDIVQGVRFAAGLSNDSNTLPPQRADVINLSLGGPSYVAEIEQIYQEVYDAGVIVVAAAGNKGDSNLNYPASYQSVISVSALDINDEITSYSSFGSAIDISAPGGGLATDNNGDGRPDGVLSTMVDDSSGERRAVYSFSQGTSMAAPHVAGMVALMKAVYPELTPQQFDSFLTSGDLTKENIGPARNDSFGYGRADALKAVQVAQRLAGGAVPPVQPISIVSSPSALNIGDGIVGSILLTNNGGGEPMLQGITEDIPWLIVTPNEVNDQGLGSYVFSVNRDGLVDGLYTGTVEFNFGTDVNVRVNISMSVGGGQLNSELGQLYPLLYDPQADNGNGAVVAQGAINILSDDSISYRFSNIAPGTYYLFAGTDIDNDGVICQVGEGCGAYPLFNEPLAIQVQDDDVSGLDMVVSLFSGISRQSSVDGSGVKNQYSNLQRLHLVGKKK